MSAAGERIAAVRAVSISQDLPVPIKYGEWVIRSREFVLVRIDAESGESGFAYCLSRNGPVAALVRDSLAPIYTGQPVERPEDAFYKAIRAAHAVHAAGIGMRALSVVDLAAWDLACRIAGQSIATRLGGRLRPMPATAIVGYPPSIDGAAVAEQVAALTLQGWRRFKLAIAPTPDLTLQRIAAAREAAPEAWIGLDMNYVFDRVSDVLELEQRLRRFGLGWIEDCVPPGSAAMAAEIRRRSEIPLAMGDDQGGSYYPEALLQADAVDAVRVDATTMGGVTRLREIVNDIIARNLIVSPHMFPHIHSRLLGALGVDAPIEWGMPGGVHPMDDSLEPPVIVDGQMQPLEDALGFGTLVDMDWISQQRVDDPERALER